MKHLFFLLIAALGACRGDAYKAFSRFADKQVQCVEHPERGMSLCKRKDGAAFVCFSERNGATVYCIRAVDPLNYKPAAEVSQ